MALTFELASFRVAPDDESALIAERPAMIEALRRAFPARRAWFRHVAESHGIQHVEVVHGASD